VSNVTVYERQKVIDEAKKIGVARGLSKYIVSFSISDPITAMTHLGTLVDIPSSMYAEVLVCLRYSSSLPRLLAFSVFETCARSDVRRLMATLLIADDRQLMRSALKTAFALRPKW
jgi:hypothetical protein